VLAEEGQISLFANLNASYQAVNAKLFSRIDGDKFQGFVLR
jgi:hypothetical protein